MTDGFGKTYFDQKYKCVFYSLFLQFELVPVESERHLQEFSGTAVQFTYSIYVELYFNYVLINKLLHCFCFIQTSTCGPVPAL